MTRASSSPRGARRFENWEFSHALVLGLGEAARYALEVGIETGGGRAQELADRVRERLAAVPGLCLHDRGPRLCAIVTAAVPGRDVGEIVRRLRQEGINFHNSLGGPGPFNAPDAQATPILRISPHYYNTPEEVDTAMTALEALLHV